MKTKISILSVLFVTASLAFQGLALAEGEYPAANFEPYIVYQAPGIAGDTSAGSENDSSQKTSEGGVSVVEEKDPYPAADLQPVIVYQEEEVIAAQKAQPAAAVTVGKPRPSKVAPAASVQEESGVPPAMMIVILALLGWVVLQFRSGGITVVEGGAAANDRRIINKTLVGESLQGDGNEVAHIDLMIGPRGSAVEAAFANALTNNKDGFSSLTAVVAPNLMAKPATVMFNKVTIKGSKQAVQMFGPAQRGVAMAVADCVENGTIPANEADDVFICVGVFIHWLAEDNAKIQDYNYAATKESIERAVAGSPTAAEVVAAKGSQEHPFAAHA
jgi:5,6,7,8-tetrahydromethanopterin hydro-lyase